MCAAAEEPNLDGRVTGSFETDPAQLAALRKRAFKLSNNLNKAIKLERYGDAAKFRDEIRELRSKDAFLLLEDMSTELKEAESQEDYQACIRLRDSMNVLRSQLVQFRLGGLWGGRLHGKVLPRYGRRAERFLETFRTKSRSRGLLARSHLGHFLRLQGFSQVLACSA